MSRTLLRELKASGARNVNPGRNRGLSGKARFAACVERLRRDCARRRLPATFEVVYGHAWRAAAGTHAPATGARSSNFMTRGARSAV